MNEKIFLYEKAEESPGFNLWLVSNVWQRKMNHGLKKFKLTHVQFVLLASLVYLLEKKEEVSQILLSNHANTDIMMTSKVLRTLEKKRFVLRKKSKLDPRAKSIYITEEGYHITKKAIQEVESIDKEFFSPIQVKKFNQDIKKLLS